MNNATRPDRTTPLDHPKMTALIFHPRPTPDAKGQEKIEVAEGVSVGARFHLGEPQWPVILFFHGNGETVADYDEVAPHFLAQDCSFIVVDYRGYGVSGGAPSASAMLADCEPIFAHVEKRLAQQEITGPLFVMGRSLGSACAIELALRHQGEKIRGLIIDSGFGATLPLLTRLGVDCAALGITEEATFGNLEKIAQVTIPTLILHGARDEIIPVGEAEELQAASGARNKQFFVVPGADHNTLMLTAGAHYFQGIRQFIDKILGRTPRWRRKPR